MKALLLAGVAIAIAIPAYAVQIATFGQTSGSNTVTATDNGTTTTISVVNATTDLTQFLNGPVSGVDFNFTATSIDAATTLGAAVVQHFSGSFCLSTAINCGGTDLLSGSFTDAAFGALGGPGLVVNTNNPPDSLTLASDVLTAAQLQAPSSFGLTFTNLVPALHLDGSTIAAFTASFGGDVSASAVKTPEPATLAVLGIGMLGIAAIRRRT